MKESTAKQLLEKVNEAEASLKKLAVSASPEEKFSNLRDLSGLQAGLEEIYWKFKVINLVNSIQQKSGR